MQSGNIKAGNFNVYYERHGKGDAVLLLHAGLLDQSMWEEQVKSLSVQYEVITADLPFHGKTTGIDTSLLVADMIKILLDSLHLQKVSIVGLSMGAASAQDFITAYPDRINKAVLISAGINGYEKDHPYDSIIIGFFTTFQKALVDKDEKKAAIEFTKTWAEGIYRKGDSLKTPVSQYVYKTALNTIQTHKVAGWPLLQEHPTAYEALATLHMPVLVINGDKDLPSITETSDYLGKNISGAKHVVMKDVAHMLNIEKPDELNKLLLDFLKSK